MLVDGELYRATEKGLISSKTIYTMGKLIFGINVTVDGCCDHTRGIPNEEVHDYFTELMIGADALLYGRKTYDLMVPFWPDYAKDNPGSADAMSRFANTFAAVPEIVVCSRTMKSSDPGKVTIINGDLEARVSELKRERRGNIITGGVDVPTQLMQLGLIDEYHIVVHPVMAGAGRRLADSVNFEKDLSLNLVRSKHFESGHIALIYIPV